jgi:DnaJ-class molecular chaperone
MLDPYKTLGVPPTATDKEIKNAYRKLAKQHHPDVNLGKADAERRFKEISEAYQLIETAELREKFKQGQYAEEARESAGPSRPFYHETQGTDNRYSQAHAEDFQDIFSSFFGGQGKTGNRDIPGEDYNFTLEIDLRDAVLGAEKEISLQPGKPIQLKIPAGVDTGTKLRLRGQGGPGFGQGKPGDAYVEIRLRPSEVFRREGADLFIELPVTLGEVVNGAEIPVPTVEGPVLMKIPVGMDTAKKLRLARQGFPDKENKKRGDLLVGLKVIMPPVQDQPFRDFIQAWSGKNPYNPRQPAAKTGGRN